MYVAMLLLLVASPVAVYSSVNGGTSCIACTASVSLVDQLALVHTEGIDKAMQRLCSFLPDDYKSVCKEFVSLAGPIIIDLLANGENPDTVCQALQVCKTEPPNPTCHMYPKPKNGFHVDAHRSKIMTKYSDKLKEIADIDICGMLPGLKQICKLADRLPHAGPGEYMPKVDFDGDGYSTLDVLRGTSWRGKDCDDRRAALHPGARPEDWDRYEDSNCNGIYGIDPVSSKPYEQLLCADSDPMGIVVLGDSGAAHFHIPGEWFTPSILNMEMFLNVTFVAGNELDWPSMSAVTGFQNLTMPIIHGWTDSLYQRLRQRNLCNHRDYQSIAVNGGACGNMNTIVKSLSRNQQKDYPVLAIYSLVANDVCNGHPDTIAHMTTPAEMRQETLITLDYLDTVLPKGSSLVITGMFDGTIVYRYMHNLFHPLGQLRKDLTYATVYEYLMCLQISPCNGWMSANETLRNLTSERGAALSRVLQDLVEKSNYTNYKLYYLDFAIGINAEIDNYINHGGSAADIFESVDGFHPAQTLQRILSEYIWSNLMAKHPQTLGRVNTNNEQILKLFGDQGGY
uniref:Acyloxyacyl hydrolase-like n=1 Tax=Saccoglossus kowalevskii TaxID=10224 RepID=A0ABM0MAB2_SACKO|nr:PREDICTED: acyloxyacyl hydrolase-like [Saccoglossus kowalevskii]